jgi:hypothetical protein
MSNNYIDDGTLVKEYFNVFRGQFSPFADALPPPVITYSSTQTKRVIGLFFDSKEWWESLPVDRREIAQQECYLPYYKLVCACCERASIKFSVESWHLGIMVFLLYAIWINTKHIIACIIAKQAMITDDTGCVQSFLKISKDRDQLMEISGPDFDNKMQQLRGEMLEFLTVLFHEYPLKLSLPLYAEISLVGFEMVTARVCLHDKLTMPLKVFGQSVGEVEVQFFDSISIAAIELIDKWRSWQSEATPKEVGISCHVKQIIIRRVFGDW